MLDESLLVAPAFTETGNVDYYLPDGVWTNFLSGERAQGGRWLHEKHGYLSLPLLVRPNSMIAVGATDGASEYDYSADVAIHLFELGDGCEAHARVYNPEGELELEVSARRSNGKIDCAFGRAGKKWKLVLHGIESIRCTGAALIGKDGSGLSVLPGSGQAFSINID